MSHNLTVDADGKAEMFYTGEVPWHGLGQKLENVATSAEAMIAARMNWRVKKFPMTIAGTDIPVPDKVAIARVNDDDSIHTIFNTSSNGYTTLDNIEAFDFFDSIVGQRLAIYHTAGVLDGGKRIWLLAKLPNDIIIKGKDAIEKFVLLTTAHDATGAIQVMCVPNRVVCRNTLISGLRDGSDKISIRHTKNAKSKVLLARETIGVTINNYRAFEEVANFLSTIPVSVEGFTKFLDKVVPIAADSTRVTREHLTDIRNQISLLFDTGKGNDIPEIKHTAWTAVNAFAEFSDHYKTVRGGSQEDRLTSIWFGAAAVMKTIAWNAALELAKGEVF